MVLPPRHPRIGDHGFDPLARLRPREVGGVRSRVWASQARFGESLREIVSVEDAERVRTVVEGVRAEWSELSRRTASDPKKWDAERARLRTDLRERLAEVLPREAEVRRLLGEHLAGLDALVRPTIGVLDPVVMPADPDLTVYRPPFSQGRLGPLASGWLDTMELVDRSFVRREIGHLVLDADLAANPGAVWGMNELFDIVPIDQAWLSASCGTTYTVPTAGRLVIDATLRNFYSRVSLALRDEWGFSDGRVSVDVTLFAGVARVDLFEVLHSPVSQQSLISYGDDVSGDMPDIEQRAWRLHAATAGVFEVGETVSVLAGVSVRVGTVLNDMRAAVRPLLWWVLDELSVGVID